MNLSTILVGLFGVFNIIGGIIGYIKAQSFMSLISGSVAGILLLLCSYGIARNSTSAVYGAIIISLLLGGRFLMTMLRNFKVMPDLIIVLFSAVTIIAGILLLTKQ